MRRPDARPATSAGRSALHRDRRAADADHPGDPEGHARRLSHPRSQRRRHRRPPGSRASRSPISRRSRRRCKGQYHAALRIRKPDKTPPPIYSISRGVGVHVFSAMPVLVNNRVAGVIYTSRTPSNIFEHLYQERGKFILAALAVIAGTMLIGLVFSPHHHRPDARTGRPRRAHRPRRPRRLPAARPLRHARVRATVEKLPRHGRAARAAIGLHRDLLGASHPRTEVAADLDQGRGRAAAGIAARTHRDLDADGAEELRLQHPRRCRAARNHDAAAARAGARGKRAAERAAASSATSSAG